MEPGAARARFAIQLAKSYGAEVTGVDSADKLDFMRSIGADHVIDYATQDFTKDGRQYDLTLDVIASRSVFACRRALRPNGSYFAVGGPAAIIFQILILGSLISLSLGKKIRILAVRPNLTDIVHVAELCEAGKVVPLIDRRYPLAETAEAIRYLGDGHVRGKVVVTVD
jgi:NADPH:quinone reductase-like Zn-dependent oxidoreductase